MAVVLTLCATQALPEALCVPGALREPLQEPLPVGQEETRGQALQEPRAGPQAGQVTQQGQEKVTLEGQEASKVRHQLQSEYLEVPVRWMLVFSHSSWLLCWCLWWVFAY